MSRVLVVPAAGAGTRLGSALPKVLTPVGGVPMAVRLLELFAPHVDSAVFVLNPAASEQTREACRGAAVPVHFLEQPAPTGMLDAILIPRELVRTLATNRVWVVWCDQVALHPDTLRRLADLDRAHPEGALSLPTASRDRPYIHLVRGTDGRIVGVLQRREGDSMPPVGEGDAGLFSMSRSTYLDLLPRFAQEGDTGSATGERNFLPFLAWLPGSLDVRTFPCVDAEESIGVNTQADLLTVEAYLARRAAAGPASRGTA